MAKVTMSAEDREDVKDAYKKVPIRAEPPPYRPPEPTGYTDQQQAAMWFSRKRRRARGITPLP